MLRGLLQSYSCTFHETEDHGNGIAFHYYRVRAACLLPSRCHGRCSRSRRAEHGHNRRAKGAGQPVHAKTSLSGPVLESNLAAIFSDML